MSSSNLEKSIKKNVEEYFFFEKDRSKYMEGALDNIRRIREMLDEFEEGDENNNLQNKLRENFIACKELHMKWMEHTNAYRNTLKHLDETEDVSAHDVQKIYEEFRSGAPSLNKANVSSDFTKIAKPRSSSKQEDLIETQVASSVIDPITKQKMTHPLKNINCKHSYDKHSIKEFLKRRQNPKCPYQGCTNEIPIVLEDLVPDEELMSELKKIK